MAKRKADSASPNKRKPKRRAAASLKDAKPETPVAKAYRRKHAARFDKPTAGPSKPEPGLYDVYAFPPTLPSPPPSDQHSPPTQPKEGDTLLVEKVNIGESGQPDALAHTISADIPEDTLLDILCNPYDSELIKTALDGVMQLAAAAAQPGDEFGVLFMQNFVNKLAGLHINGAWLAEIVNILQQHLRSLCDRAQCRIGSLGKLALRKGRTAESHLEMVQTGDAVHADANPGQEDFPRTVYVKHGTAKTESVNIEEDATHSSSHVVPAKKQKKGGKRKTKETPQHSSLQSLVQQALTQGLDVPDEASQTWQPNDRTSSFYLSNAPLNSVYDLFVVSAIDAHRFAVGEPIEIINAYANRVRKIWHRVESDHKAGWVKLFNARPAATSPSVRGQRLLESQGLLVKFLPDADRPDHRC
jgi:hypothetical protein